MLRGYTAATWRIRRYEEADRWVLRRSPQVLCVSEGSRRILASHGLRSERITVVHNAVDCDLADQVQPRDLRNDFSLPPASKIVVAAGRLSPEKGHSELLQALMELRQHTPPVHLVLLGQIAVQQISEVPLNYLF